jgi:putative NADH-flavin reductase
MTKPMIRIHDISTDEVIDREMTKDEIADHEAIQAAFVLAEAEAEAKVEARQAILDRLGLTSDEAALLLG